MRKLLPLLFFILITACSAYDYSPPPATPEHTRVIHTPALGWMRETLHQCALDHPEIALTVDEWPSTALDVGAAEATLWLGSPPEGYSGSATLLGWEQIVIIANPDIPLTEIELADIRQIYTSIEPQYQAWSFPENSELRVVFDEVVLENNQISPHTKIAPNPGKLLEAIDGGSQGLGYIT